MAENDQTLRKLYAASAARQPTEHPDEATWERMALGELPPAEREALFDHVTRCASCAQVHRGLKMLATEAVSFDPGVPAPRPIPREPLPWPTRWVYAGLAAAAAVVLVLLVPLPQPKGSSERPGATPSADPLRSQPAAVPVPLEPLDALPTPPRRFRWQAVAGISRYRVELATGSGDRLWSSPPVSDTTVDWPASITPAPGRYYWQVVALPDVDHPMTSVSVSPLVSFDLTPTPSPAPPR